MSKQQATINDQKQVQLAIWKRLILIAGMLLPGGSLALLIPSQTAYADPQFIYMCRAGDGGNGGVAINGSNGAGGAPGGDCIIGAKADGAPGGDHGSPGGNGGVAVFH